MSNSDAPIHSTTNQAMTRRRFLALAAALGGAAGTVSLLAGCQQPSAAPTAPKPAATTAPKPAATTAPAAAAATAPAAAATAKAVNVAVLYPQSGDFARFGIACVNATRLAADTLNQAGGIKALGGAKINLVIEDITSDPNTVRSVTDRVLSRGDLAAATGNYASNLTLISTEIAERRKVPYITGSIADNITGRGYKYTFQVSPKGSMFGNTQMEFADQALKGLKGKKVAIVYENTDYGTSTSKGLQDGAKKLGAEIVMFESYSQKLTDAAPLVNKIKAANPALVFPVSYLNDAILIVKTIKQFGISPLIVGGGAGYIVPEFASGLGADADGVLSVASWNWDLKKKGVAEFAAAYKQRYNEFLMEHAGEAYTMLYVLAEAMAHAKSAEPDKVREALANLALEEGEPGNWMPGGNLKFDATGWNSSVHPVMVQWKDKEPRTVYPAGDAVMQPILPKQP